MIERSCEYCEHHKMHPFATKGMPAYKKRYCFHHLNIAREIKGEFGKIFYRFHSTPEKLNADSNCQWFKKRKGGEYDNL